MDVLFHIKKWTSITISQSQCPFVFNQTLSYLKQLFRILSKQSCLLNSGLTLSNSTQLIAPSPVIFILKSIASPPFNTKICFGFMWIASNGTTQKQILCLISEARVIVSDWINILLTESQGLLVTRKYVYYQT